MKHARSDYQNRIIDKANLIPENEPVFLLRGQDQFAAATLEFYADSLKEERIALEIDFSMRENIDSQDEYYSELEKQIIDLLEVEILTRKQASEMRSYQTKKCPDLKNQNPSDSIEIEDSEEKIREDLALQSKTWE